MKTMQKTFTVKLKTTNPEIDRNTIRAFINTSIDQSKYAGELRYTVEDNVGTLYNFLNDCMAFSLFIRSTKEDFLKEYPYFAEEYDFCLSEFNKNKESALIEFLENTKTEELTEPYGLTPKDFSFSVGVYVKSNMTYEEQVEFLKEITSRGLKVEISQNNHAYKNVMCYNNNTRS